MAQRRAPGSCLDHAMALLARRPHSVREIEKKLKDKGHGRKEIGDAVERLLGLGYLDDESVCRDYAASRVRRARVGPARLRMDLARKGFGKELVEKTLGEVYGEEGAELAIARRAAARKARSLKQGLGRDEMRIKIFDHLARRGFNPETARRLALDELDEILRRAEEEG